MPNYPLCMNSSHFLVRMSGPRGYVDFSHVRTSIGPSVTRLLPARQFLGSDYDKVVDLINKSVLGYEDSLFRINRRMTIPAKQWVAAGPTFWSGKAVAKDSASNKKNVVRRATLNKT